jgi:hypothetical protein
MDPTTIQIENHDPSDLLDAITSALRDSETTWLTEDGQRRAVIAPAPEGGQPTMPDLQAAARAAIPALVLLGDFIGNTFDGKVGIPAFDRCGVILALREALAKAEVGLLASTLAEGTIRKPARPGREALRGQCEFCHAADVNLAAVLSADPDQVVCEACHADPRLPTVSLAAVNDGRPVYVVSRGDLARLAGREVTDSEAARIARAIGNSTASEAIGDAVWQVCGPPGTGDRTRPEEAGNG